MSVHLVCDWCNKQIFHGQVYYTVHMKSNDNPFYSDSVNDICCDCARKLSVDLDHEYKEEEEVLL